MKESPPDTEEIELDVLLDAIHRRHDFDFRGYSRASMKRRVKQALKEFGCGSISALQDKLLHDPDVMPRLLPLLTVQVSEMFRDPGYFEFIRSGVVPHLQTYPTLKVWIAGCSTGEELYSFAILFREAGLEARTVFYATDLNPVALKQAESGTYPMENVPLFTRNYQKAGGTAAFSDYYTAGYGRAAFDRTLTSRTVFARHNLASDAVFAEVNLVSCRNVMIYFDRTLQDRAVGLFRDSLSSGGFLGIGPKETLRFSPHAAAFADFSREHRVYRRGLA